MIHRPSKVAAAKNFLQRAYYRLDECFLFHVITGRHCFFNENLQQLRSFFQPPEFSLFEIGVLREARVLRYLHHNITTPIPKFLKQSCGKVIY